jgi:hypothetical protein
MNSHSTFHVSDGLTQAEWDLTPDSKLEEWSVDPSCPDQSKKKCLVMLLDRKARREEERTGQARSFYPRTEVSADARYIVRNLWIMFLIPAVIGVVWAL